MWIKYNDKPLLLICNIRSVGSFTLSEIKTDIPLNNINIKYDFIILPVNNNELIISDDEFDYRPIEYISTEVLDFTSTDSLIVEYYTSPDELKGVTFNPDSSDLVCEDLKNMKKCTVPKSHFDGKKSGFYFTMHENHLNKKSYSFEIPPIKVILPGSESNDTNNETDTNNNNYTLIIIISAIGGIIIIGLIIFIICYCKKKAKNDKIEDINKNDDNLELLNSK